MSRTVTSEICVFVDHQDDTEQVRPKLATLDSGAVSLRIAVAVDHQIAFIGDPARIVTVLDAARQLVIDHLVATVGVPATMVVERKLLADTLHEGWDTLPSPITHRLKSVLAGDQPEPTGRTTVAALTERQQEHGEVACKRCGKVFGGWAGPAGPDDPDPDEVLGALCSTCSAALASVEAKNARLLTGAGGGA